MEERVLNTLEEALEKNIRELEKPIEELGLSRRAKNVLFRLKCKTLRDVVKTKPLGILCARNCGIVALREIAKKLRDCGFPNAELEHYVKGIERYGSKDAVLRRLTGGARGSNER